MIEIASGVVSQYDAQLRENVDNMRDQLRSMVPSSMMVIRNAIAGKYGHNLAFKAATEVLDREGTNAKVSKSTVAHEIVPIKIKAGDIEEDVAPRNLKRYLIAVPNHWTIRTSRYCYYAAGIAENPRRLSLGKKLWDR